MGYLQVVLAVFHLGTFMQLEHIGNKIAYAYVKI